MRLFTIILLMLVYSCVNVGATMQCSTNYCNDFVIGKPSIQSNSTAYINDMIINIGVTTDNKGHLYRQTSTAIIPTANTGSNGGSAITLYYDVLLELNKQKYKPNENINAEITIINKGYVPDKDGILTTYLLSPNGTKYKEEIAVFELIPPTCTEGKYDWYEDSCLDSSGKNVSSPKKTIIKRELALPDNPQQGEWKFYVEYQTNVQPLIKVSAPFDVTSIDYSWLLIAGIVLFAYFSTRKKKQ